MTVRQLRKMLEGMEDEARVYIANPTNGNGSEQEVHENFEARYIVSDRKGKVWFETYGGEDIATEISSVIDYSYEYNLSDDDYVCEVLSPEGHGYTLEDIRKNCDKGIYDFLIKAGIEHGIITESDITKEMARGFFNDVCGTFHTNGNSGIVSVDFVAERMGITTEQSEMFFRACAKYGITERQGGAWVI